MKGGRGKRDERVKENERRTARKEGEREEKGVENRGLKLKGENRDRERETVLMWISLLSTLSSSQLHRQATGTAHLPWRIGEQ